MASPSVPVCKSPARMQSHLVNRPELSIEEQLLAATEWISQKIYPDEKILCCCHDIPAKLQDGPQCGLVSLWMAGRFLQPSDNPMGVGEIQNAAIGMGFSNNGEMFSAANMAELAESVFPNCTAAVWESSFDNLVSLRVAVDAVCTEENLILVPYDSDSDQWPCLKKGHKAHWGLIIGMAFILPYNNKAVQQAQVLDGYVSLCKPPLLRDQAEAIVGQTNVKHMFIVRQSKSKRLFMFEPRALARSNSNLAEFCPPRTKFKHEKVHDPYVVPKGGIQEGLNNKCVVLSKKS